MQRPSFIRDLPSTSKPLPLPRYSPAALVLADGRSFIGYAGAGAGEAFGEVVFNTAMTGYQEVLTDPSYRSQIVVMTYPHIGNYGVQPTDGESTRIQLAGLVTKKICRTPSHAKNVSPLPDYLASHSIPAIEGIDTRALVRHIRSKGAQPAVLTTHINTNPTREKLDALAQRAADWHAQASWNLGLHAGAGRPYTMEPREHYAVRSKTPVIVALDFGIKEAIVRQLQGLGARVHVLPASSTPDAVKRLQPDGIFLSNGPGDPRDLSICVDTVRALLGTAPIFGICLGHQLLGLALGGSVEKMRFGHRGANHPVLDRVTGNIEITSQNHGYALLEDSLPEHVDVTHINLNDNTVEGLSVPNLRAFSVQYHPEACPGPHDAHHHFHRFMDNVLAVSESKATTSL